MIRRLLCRIFGHRYRPAGSSEIMRAITRACMRCGRRERHNLRTREWE